MYITIIRVINICYFADVQKRVTLFSCGSERSKRAIFSKIYLMSYSSYYKATKYIHHNIFVYHSSGCSE